MTKIRRESLKPGDFEVADDVPVFTSGVISRLLEIPVWVLKQLDREKVVSPARQKGKTRLYSKKELQTVYHVWYYMRERHVNVSGVKVILEMEERFGLSGDFPSGRGG